MSDELTQAELVELEARSAAATPGPWTEVIQQSDHAWAFVSPHVIRTPGPLAEIQAIKFGYSRAGAGGWATEGKNSLDAADMRFIATARNVVPKLCDAYRHSLAEIAGLKDQLARVKERAERLGWPDPFQEPLRQATPQQPPTQAEQLHDLMSEISEECWCAGWLGGLEFSLWAFVLKGEPVRFGQDQVDGNQIAELKRLSEAAGGWVVLARDHKIEPNMTRWGCEAMALMPMADWLKDYAEAQRGEAAP